MDRNTVLWTIAVFFGASIMFTMLRRATEDSSTAVTLLVQLGAGLLLVGVIVLIVRRNR